MIPLSHLSESVSPANLVETCKKPVWSGSSQWNPPLRILPHKRHMVIDQLLTVLKISFRLLYLKQYWKSVQSSSDVLKNPAILPPPFISFQQQIFFVIKGPKISGAFIYIKHPERELLKSIWPRPQGSIHMFDLRMNVCHLDLLLEIYTACSVFPEKLSKASEITESSISLLVQAAGCFFSSGLGQSSILQRRMRTSPASKMDKNVRVPSKTWLTLR